MAITAILASVSAAVETGTRVYQAVRGATAGNEASQHWLGKSPPYLFYKYRQLNYVFEIDSGRYVASSAEAESISRRKTGNKWWIDHTVEVSEMGFSGFETRGGMKYDKGYDAVKRYLPGYGGVMPTSAPPDTTPTTAAPTSVSPTKSIVPLLVIGAFLFFLMR